MNNTEIITAIISGVFTLLGLLVTYFLVPWLKKKAELIEDEKVRNATKLALELADGTVQRVVESTSQTLVKEFRKNGTWNEETKKLVLDRAVAEIKRSLGQDQLLAIGKTLNISVEEFLITAVEAYIHKNNPNN